MILGDFRLQICVTFASTRQRGLSSASPLKWRRLCRLGWRQGQ